MAMAGSAAVPADTEQELLRIEREWSEALARHDTTFFERVLADDYIATGGLDTLSKRQFITANLSGPPSPEANYELGETRIRQYGSVVVITGLVTFGQHMRARYTEVWTKEHRQWQAHLGHYSHLSDADTMR